MDHRKSRSKTKKAYTTMNLRVRPSIHERVVQAAREDGAHIQFKAEQLICQALGIPWSANLEEVGAA